MNTHRRWVGLLLALLFAQITPSLGTAAVYDGVYRIESVLQANGTPVPSVVVGVAAFDELVDDDELSGDLMAGSFGLDPAAYLMDFVYREFCCWEASPGADFDSCQAQATTHPSGDLRDLYLESFSSWDGAQSRFVAACAGLSLSNESVQQLAQDQVTAVTPFIVTSLPQIASDLDAVFSTLRLVSELEITNLGPGESGVVTHTLTHLVADLHDFDGNSVRFLLDLSGAGLTNLSWTGMASTDLDGILTIPAHDFRVDLGRLLQQLWVSKVLPYHGVATTADLFSLWVDCGPIGTVLADEGGTLVGAATYSAYCEVGVLASAARFDSELAAMVSSETTLTLDGTGTPTALDPNMIVVGLDGTWNGTLGEDMITLGAANGTFSLWAVLFYDGFESRGAKAW
jgi:hypothetical protein